MQVITHLDSESKGWNPKQDRCDVEEATNNQDYGRQGNVAVWWWILDRDCGTNGGSDQWLHWSLEQGENRDSFFPPNMIWMTSSQVISMHLAFALHVTSTY